MTTNYGQNPDSAYSNFIGEVWSKKINVGLSKNCVMLQCVNRDYQADADKGVEAVNIIAPSDVVVAPYTGEFSSYETSDATTMVLELNQNVSFGLTVPDIDQAQSNVNIAESIAKKAEIALNSAIDQFIFSQYINADSKTNAIGTAEEPVELTPVNIYAYFVDLSKRLKNSGALNCANKGWVVVNPAVEEVLLLSSQFTSASTLSDGAIKEGAIGKIAGLDVFVSSNVGEIAEGKFVVLAGVNDAITFASQLKKIETLRAENSFSSIIRGLYTFGALTLQPKGIATLTCTVSTSQGAV